MQNTGAVTNLQLAQLLLPQIANLKLVQLTQTDNTLTIHLASTKSAEQCPACDNISHRVHNYYLRKVTDLAWGDYQVKLQIQVRRFYCPIAACPKVTFAERLGPNIAAYARRTARLDAFLTQLALSSGGKPGAKLAQHSQIKVSPTTLLRLIERSPLPPFSPAHLIGVDDFAWRKGQRYGTILVDLATHRPLALLADREANTLSQWLAQHEARAKAHGISIEVISRDRNSAYARAARETVPQAVQVADRFHLKANVHDTVRKVVRRLYPALTPLLQKLYSPPVAAQTRLPTESNPAPPIVREGFSRLVTPSEKATAHSKTCPSQAGTGTGTGELHLSYWDKQKAITQQNRAALYHNIQELAGQGHKTSQIAQMLNISPKQVKRLTALKEPPVPTVYKKRPHQLDPYRAYLQKRFFKDGYDNALGLSREIKERGYGGSAGVVSNYITKLRSFKGGIELGGNPRRTQPFNPEQEQLTRLPSAYELSWWLMMDRAKLKAPIANLSALCAEQVELAKTYELVQQFNRLLAERQACELDKWLTALSQSQVAELVSLGRGMRKDEKAIRAGLTLPYSQGVVEGTINKLKALKRQMYGRAGLNLLTKRLLAA